MWFLELMSPFMQHKMTRLRGLGVCIQNRFSLFYGSQFYPSNTVSFMQSCECDKKHQRLICSRACFIIINLCTVKSIIYVNLIYIHPHHCPDIKMTSFYDIFFSLEDEEAEEEDTSNPLEDEIATSLDLKRSPYVYRTYKYRQPYMLARRPGRTVYVSVGNY